MAEIRMKHPIGKKARVAESHCASGVRNEVQMGDGHTLIIDEPAKNGGTGEGASPLNHFNASLAACQTVQIGQLFNDAGFPPTIIWNVLPLKE